MLQIIATLALLCILPACLNQSKSPTRKTLRVTESDSITTFDPAVATDGSSLRFLSLVYESLYQYSIQDEGRLEPLLAESMPTVSSNGLIYTVKIKKGVKYQDSPIFPGGMGREVKAQDFIFAWKRLFHPKTSAARRLFFEGKILGLDSFAKRLRELDEGAREKYFLQPISGLSAIDDSTLQIQLTHPSPSFIHMMAALPSAPLPHEVVSYYGYDGLNDHMIGTGSYRFKSYTRGSNLTLERNPKFRGESFAGKTLPFLDEIQIRFLKEESAMWLHFLNRDIDIVTAPSDLIQSNQTRLNELGVQIQKVHTTGVTCLTFNMNDPIVGTKKQLRVAISQAIDRDKWIQQFLGGDGVKATSIIPPQLNKSQRTKLLWDFDIQSAKKNLALAGYPSGKGLPPLQYDTYGTDSAVRKWTDFLAQSLNEIGIRLELGINTPPVFITKMKKGHLNMFLGTLLASYPDPENSLRIGYGPYVSPGPNSSHWKNSHFDRLYESILSSTNPQERLSDIEQAEAILLEDMPVIPLYFPVENWLSHKGILNFQPRSSIVFNKLKYIDIE